jgi:hypothetical protein
MSTRVGDSIFLATGNPGVITAKDKNSGRIAVDEGPQEVAKEMRHGYINGLSVPERDQFNAIMDITREIPEAEDRVKAAATKPGPAVASDAELDGQYGDPEVKAKDPRDWTGPPMHGRRFSECPAEYLEMLAERYDYFVSQNAQATDEEKKKANYNRKDAARARGWAERIRSGKHRPAVRDESPEWAGDY